MSDPSIEFSAVISCYFEEKSIEEFHARLTKTLRNLGRPYEIIFVNDGSTDKTFDKLKIIYEQDPHVSVIMDLFRNAGQPGAVTAGLCYARGEKVIFLDSDLQLDPEELPLLAAKYDEGYDVVSGYRKNRKDPLSRTLPSKIANYIMRKVSRSRLTDFGCSFKIINARLIRGFEFGPYKPLRLPNLIGKAHRCVEVPITHHPRKYGKSGWTFKKLFAYNMDNIVSLSQRPFQVLGFLCLGFAFLFLLRVGISWVIDFSIISEISNGLLLNAIVFSLLVIVAILCMVGEFVIRNFIVLQRHPAYIIREIYQKHVQEGRNN